MVRLSIGAGLHFLLLDWMKESFVRANKGSDISTAQNIVIGGEPVIHAFLKQAKYMSSSVWSKGEFVFLHVLRHYRPINFLFSSSLVLTAIQESHSEHIVHSLNDWRLFQAKTMISELLCVVSSLLFSMKAEWGTQCTLR